MNIIHVTPYYPPHLGGVEVVAMNLSSALAKMGNNVTVITSSIQQESNNKSEEGIRIRPKYAIELGHVPLAPGLFLEISNQLLTADLLHVHAGIAYYPEIALLSSKLMHKPLIVTFHCDTEPSGPLGFLLNAYKRIFLKKVLLSADRIVCLTIDHAKAVHNDYSVPFDKIRVVPNGIDELFFDLSHPKIKKDKTIKLLFVGRLAKQKNIPRLIESVELLSKKYKITLNIVGGGEEEKRIREIISSKKLGDKINFLGIYNKKDKLKWQELFQKNDIFVVPSDYEGVPVALMEAMAAGVPVVATNVRGIKEFAKGLSVLTEPNAKSLANGIEKMFLDITLRKRLSRKASKAMKKLRWQTTAKMYETVYLEVVR
jgi:glycosyltransferase involved in cell wall biosynthesis